MAVAATDVERELQRLESELRRLEAEYNMFFAGRLPRPPWETRSRVEALFKQGERSALQNYGDRFRFNTMQSRFSAFVDLWDRGLRARDEGRPGPFARAGTGVAPAKTKSEPRVLYVASFHDPIRQIEKLTELYDSIADAKQQVGEAMVPFHKFAELVKNQVTKLRQAGSTEVAFRVALKDGKVSFTARALKGMEE